MSTPTPSLRISADFPGGNIVVESIDGDIVSLHQDLRDTSSDWFYWYFAVRGAAGRTLTFRFTTSPALGVRGPALSLDGGETWAWAGAACVSGNSFTYRFADTAQEVRFSFGMPYQEARLRRFLARHAGNPRLRGDTLCRTPRGRDVERLHLGCLQREPCVRVLLTCRHHACEMMADYVLEGLMDAVLAGAGDAAWLAENAEIMAIPFVDKDGVEDGDQGKNRRPRDHNRDYDGESVHASTRALRETVPAWSGGRLLAAMDLHCPHIRGPHNEVVYLVGAEDAAAWQEQCRLGAALESVTAPDGLPYVASDNLPFGQAWNTGSSYSAGLSCSSWARHLPGIRLATSIEIPYANARGAEVNQTTAVAFGHRLAKALARYLRDVPPST